MSQEKNPRLVNRAVGMQLKIGMLPLSQLALIGMVGFVLLYLTLLLKWPFYIGLLIFALISGTLIALLGEKPWLFLHKFAKPPQIVRGGSWYHPLLQQNRKTRKPR